MQTIEEIARTILNLPKEKREELRSLLEQSERLAFPICRYETARIEDIDGANEKAKEWPLVVRDQAGAGIQSEADASVTCDVFSLIKEDPANLSRPVILACIRRWQKIVVARHHVPDYVYEAASQHLMSIGETLFTAARNQQPPVELAKISQVSREEIRWLARARDALCERKGQRGQWSEKIASVKEQLKSERTHSEEEAIVSLPPGQGREFFRALIEIDTDTPHIEKVIEFIRDRENRRCGTWEEWRNAYIAWRIGLDLDTVKKYLPKAGKQTGEYTDKASTWGALGGTTDEPFSDGRDPADLYGQTLLIEKTWAEIEDPTACNLDGLNRDTAS